MADCEIEINDSELLTGCPDLNAKFLLESPDSTALQRITFATLLNCFLETMFGVGIKTITGSQLNGSNQYLNNDLLNDLVVFSNGVNRYLINGSEWNYVLDGSDVIGVEILIPYAPGDIFVISPNPTPP